MQKLLIAGPRKVDSSWRVNLLGALIKSNLERFFFQSEKLEAVVVASDTLTGALAFNHAIDLRLRTIQFSADIRGDLIDAEGREAIAIRNAKMISEPDIIGAMLFVQTNECTDFIQAISARKPNQKPIQVIRIMG